MDKGFWDSSKKDRSSIIPAALSNCMGYTVEDTPAIEWLDNPASVSTFGIQSSATAAISLAVMLGFHNIILHGCPFRGSVGDFYCFDEIPHRNDLIAKLKKYEGIYNTLSDIRSALMTRAIRLYATEDYPYSSVIRLTKDYFKDTVSSIMALTKMTKQAARITMPLAARKHHVSMLAKHRLAIVSPVDVLDNMESLITLVPDVFGTEAVRVEYTEYKKSAAGGGCTGCKKNRHARPMYEVFEREVQSGNDLLNEVWAKLLPDKYIVKVDLIKGTAQGELIFRKDHPADEKEYKDQKDIEL